MTNKLLPCPFCGGNVDPTGWLRGDGVRGPECEDCGSTASSMDVWNKRAAQEAPRQEPVAEVQHGPFDDVGAPQWVRVVTLGDFDLENLPDGMKLYAAPLSPDHSGGAGKVVLPERKATISFGELDIRGEAWNACLDKFKELNQ